MWGLVLTGDSQDGNTPSMSNACSLRSRATKVGLNPSPGDPSNGSTATSQSWEVDHGTRVRPDRYLPLEWARPAGTGAMVHVTRSGQLQFILIRWILRLRAP
jgi:hypothetical protein